jgi:hypothetical protein
VTPTLSVEAVQAIEMAARAIAVTCRSLGAEGDVRSTQLLGGRQGGLVLVLFPPAEAEPTNETLKAATRATATKTYLAG